MLVRIQREINATQSVFDERVQSEYYEKNKEEKPNREPNQNRGRKDRKQNEQKERKRTSELGTESFRRRRGRRGRGRGRRSRSCCDIKMPHVLIFIRWRRRRRGGGGRRDRRIGFLSRVFTIIITVAIEKRSRRGKHMNGTRNFSHCVTWAMSLNERTKEGRNTTVSWIKRKRNTTKTEKRERERGRDEPWW
jgi:hypothetical protein